jgi:hypothetical protein
MIEEIRRELQRNMGCWIEIETKRMEKVNGTLSWVSPDRSMAELTLPDGSIKTITDVQIRKIKK